MDEESPLLLNSSQQDVKMRQLSYLSSAVCCFLSGSFAVFSLYTNAFESELHYTPLQINYVSIAAEMGLYLCVPILGYVADAYRLSYVGAAGAVTYLVGYAGCSWVVHTHQSWVFMAFFFAIVGVGCSATYISSLVNCARLYPETALLAISIPTTLYGFSSMMFARITSLYIDSDGSLYSFFTELSIVLCLIGALAAAAPIWGRVDESAGPAGAQVSEEIPEDVEGLVLRFFKDNRILLFLASFMFVSGPLEMFQNDVGLIVKQSGGSTGDVAHQVGLFNFFSTVTRLGSGAVIDVCKAKPPILLMSIVVLVAVVNFVFAQQWMPFLSVVSSISGMGYGGCFTLYPLIVSQVWGIEGFATNYGFFVLSPAVGMLLFGLKFAHDFEQGDIASTFRFCALAGVAAYTIIWRLKLTASYD